MEPVDVRGRFAWHQLMTRDTSGAKNFYSKVAGWKTEAWPHNPDFTVCLAKSGPVAGIMTMPPGSPAEAPSMWINYIGTNDVDGTAEEAVKLGGKIVKNPTDEPGAGRYAVLQDPQGAVFAAIKPMVAPADNASPTLGGFSWHELATTDNEAAFSFYSALFGWEALQRIDMGPIGVYLIFGSNGRQRGGIYHKPADMPGPSFWLPYAEVVGADATHALAVKSGGASLTPPMDVPGGSRIAIIADPAGAAFAVVTSNMSAAPKAKAPAAKKAAAPKPAAKKAAAKKPAARKAVVKKAAAKKAPAKKAAPKKAAKKTARKGKPAKAKKAKAKSKTVRRKK
jgi:uncharacterized protein